MADYIRLKNAHGKWLQITPNGTVQGVDALRVIQLALSLGFTRIGVQQKGEGRFIHLGDSPAFAPGLWSY